MIYDKYILSISPILAVSDRAGTADSCYGTKKQGNTHNNVIEVETTREMAVDKDKKYQGKVESADNMLCQLKQRDHVNKLHDILAVPSVGGVSYVSRYPLLEPVGVDTDIYYGVVKIRAATLLGDIVRLHQCTKIPLNYVHMNSRYEHLVEIPDSDTHKYYTRAAIDKGWVKRKFFSIRQLESKKIMWPWHNICKRICLRNMKMKQFLPLLIVVYLSVLPLI